MKKEHLFWIIPASLLLMGLCFWALPRMAQQQIISNAHQYQTTSVKNSPYLLETTRQERDDGVFASFVVKGEDGEVLFACPDVYRTSDLKSIAWSDTGYDIVVRSGDVGTVVYPFIDHTWRIK